jgi:glycosyltransferase involved in cell wall biosynthesis
MTDNRPLVTFAISCYNQERYVSSAIYSAFLQTYTPLEIIISDDCSSDHSWPLIKDLVSGYRGKHHVIARQSKTNLGTYRHLLDIASISSGSLIVFACGDDISKPMRAEVLCKNWISTGAWALDSKYDLINNEGRVLLLNQYAESLDSADLNLRQYFFIDDGPVSIVHGASSAYDRRIFSYAPPSSKRILSEDGVLSILLNMYHRKIVHIDQSLLLYRFHDEAISNSPITSELSIDRICHCFSLDEKRASHLCWREELLLLMGKYPSPNVRNLNLVAIFDNYIIQLARARWHLLGFPVKYKALVVATRKKQLGYLLPAILGIGPSSLLLFFKKLLAKCIKLVLAQRSKQAAKTSAW